LQFADCLAASSTDKVANTIGVDTAAAAANAAQAAINGEMLLCMQQGTCCQGQHGRP
jgi:hypothetical protein